MVTVTIGKRKLAGVEQPIELLKDCHRRIEHFLGVLEKVVEQYGEGILPDEGRRALQVSLDYFADAAPWHAADEEQSLFPRLRVSNDAAARRAMAEIDRLERDHRSADACHARVAVIGRQWLAEGCLALSDRTTLRALLAELRTVYTSHIRLEEEQIFVLASRLLSASDIREVGKEMRRRRGNDTNHLSDGDKTLLG